MFCYVFVSNRVEKKNPWGSLESICPLFWGCFTLKTRVLYNQNIEYPDTCFISSNLVLRVLYILNTNKKLYPPEKTNMSPDKGCLEVLSFPFEMVPFQVSC